MKRFRRHLDNRWIAAGWVVGAVILLILRAVWWDRWEYSNQPLVALTTFVLVGELGALWGMLLIRRSVELATLEAHRESAGFVYATLGAAYAVLLSFMVVVSWDQYHDDRRTINSEALAASTLFHLADGLDAATRRDVQQTLLTYTQVVLQEEWPGMARGEESARAWQLSDQLWDVYSRVPVEEQGRPAYAQSLADMQQFYSLRGRRLLDSRNSLPSPVWMVLSAGAIITVGFTYLFGAPKLLAQIIITAGLTAIIAGSLYLIVDFDTPYSGPLQLDRLPFESNETFFTERLQP